MTAFSVGLHGADVSGNGAFAPSLSQKLRRRQPARLGSRDSSLGAGGHALPRISGYRIERTVGKGRRSTAYLARNVLGGDQVVLKVLDPAAGDNPVRLASFAQEFAIPSAMRHDNVIRVFDQVVGDGVAYIAMEYLDGGHLGEWIHRGLSAPEAVSLLRQAAQALAEVHRRGVVHRDVKPANLLLRVCGKLVIADFGLACWRDQGVSVAPRGQLVGTPSYVSPEQAQGEVVLAAADIYSLGVVFYEMLCGRTPFPGNTLMEQLSQHLMAPVPRLPGALERYQPLLDAMLEKHAACRLPDAQAVLEGIDRLERYSAVDPCNTMLTGDRCIT